MIDYKRYQNPLRPKNILDFLFSSGFGIFSSIFSIIIFSSVIYALVEKADFTNFFDNVLNSYILSIIKFTFLQAGLSTFLSVSLGLLVALFMLKYSKSNFIKYLNYFFGVAFVSPVIIIVFAIVKIHGLNGWVNQFLSIFDLTFGSYLYGLRGILLAHIFLNMPFAARSFYLALRNINADKYMLASQLGFNNWQIFKNIELIEIKKVLIPISVLIFILCFTSFAAVITLGGNPGNSTLEASIYQAIKYDFNLPLAINFALIQLIFCLSFLIISNYFKTSNIIDREIGRPRNNFKNHRPLSWLFDITSMIIILSFILIPFLAIIPFDVKLSSVINFFDNTAFRAILTSLKISIFASLIALFLTLSIISYSTYLKTEKQYKKLAYVIENSSLLILILPSILFSVGLFLLIRKFSSLQLFSEVAVISVNIFVIMPFMIKIISCTYKQTYEKYELLNNNLGLNSFEKLFIVILPNIKPQIAFALAVGASFSLGDLGAIAIFGSEDLLTLPLLLYGLLGSYQLEKAAICALTLSLLCICVFVLIDYVILNGLRSIRIK